MSPPRGVADHDMGEFEDPYGDDYESEEIIELDDDETEMDAEDAEARLPRLEKEGKRGAAWYTLLAPPVKALGSRRSARGRPIGV